MLVIISRFLNARHGNHDRMRLRVQSWSLAIGASVGAARLVALISILPPRAQLHGHASKHLEESLQRRCICIPISNLSVRHNFDDEHLHSEKAWQFQPKKTSTANASRSTIRTIEPLAICSCWLAHSLSLPLFNHLSILHVLSARPAPVYLRQVASPFHFTDDLS